MIFACFIIASSTVRRFSTQHLDTLLASRRYTSSKTPFFESPYVFKTPQHLTFFAQYQNVICQTFDPKQDAEFFTRIELEQNKHTPHIQRKIALFIKKI